MEVVRKTFKDKLSFVEQCIKNAIFVAIDGEYSGLCSHKNKAILENDTVQDRYEKIADSAKSFFFFQFGMTVFSLGEEKNYFDAKPFSFYLFSDPSKSLGLERRQNIQSSSASFLAEYSFDFNKVFYEGIPYLSRAEELSFRQRDTKAQPGAEQTLVAIPPDQTELITRTMSNITTWFQDSITETYQLVKMNSFQRLLIYQQIRQKFGDSIIASKNNDGLIVLRKSSFEANLELKNKYELELDDQIGFRKVIDLLIENKTPIVAHNSMLDIFHMYTQFIDRLPDEVTLAKKLINSHFPFIIDTKLLSRDPLLYSIFQEKSLCDLYTICTSGTSPLNDLNINISFSTPFDATDNSRFHDAAFDSYCTGIVFLKMIYYLFSVETDISLPNINEAFARVFSSSFYYANKLNMMKTPIRYFNLVADDEMSLARLDRDTPLFLKDCLIITFHAEIDENSIKDHFWKLGAFSVRPLNSKSVILVFTQLNEGITLADILTSLPCTDAFDVISNIAVDSWTDCLNNERGSLTGSSINKKRRM